MTVSDRRERLRSLSSRVVDLALAVAVAIAVRITTAAGNETGLVRARATAD